MLERWLKSFCQTGRRLFYFVEGRRAVPPLSGFAEARIAGVEYSPGRRAGGLAMQSY